MPDRSASLLVLYNTQGKILLQHRDMHAIYYPGFWGFFGGGIETGETPEQALKREIREELEIEMQDIPLFRTYTIQEDTGIKIRHIFLAPTNSTLEEIKQHQHEGSDAGFFSEADVKELKVNPYTQHIFDDVFAEVRLRLHRIKSKTKQQVIFDVTNQSCWRAWRGYRSAIFFELGDKFPDGADDKNLRKGTYTLSISQCPWQIFKSGAMLFNSQTDFKKQDELLSLFEHQKLRSIQFNAKLHEETITFSNDLVIMTYHNEPDDEWYILTPDVEFIVSADKVKILPYR